MKRIIFSVLLLLMVVSVVALAQTTRYTYVKNFPDDAFRTRGGNSGHGIAVDPDGKIWFQAYDWSDSVLVASTGKYATCRVVFVWNRDGTPASFSPIKTVTVGGVTDTLWNSAVGLRTDAKGNIAVATYTAIYRLNYKTGAGMTRVIQNTSAKTVIQPAFDSYNEMFTGWVIPVGPIKIYDEAFAYLGNVADSVPGYARSMEVSADGNDVFWTPYTTGYSLKFHSDNGSLGPYSKIDTVFKGYGPESITRHPKTGNYWVSGGSAVTSVPTYRNNKWYEFKPPDYNTPIDSLTWNGQVTGFANGTDPRPRGIAFSVSGDTAYAVQFGSNLVGPVQMFVKKASTMVTFQTNTATVPDTLKSGSFVQIRGSANLFGPWGPTSSAMMKSVAGDYWSYTASLNPGDTIYYKFFTFAKGAPLATANNDQGWENDLTPSNDRVLIVPKKDTVLPLQFVNGTPAKQGQWFTPYVNKPDSIEVWFRINMSGNESFKKTSQYMGVRGGLAPPYDGWGKSLVLTQEQQHGNGGSRQYDATNFWSGYARMPKSAFASAIEYKFVIMDAASPTANIVAWEDGIKAASDVTGGGNRQILASPGISDTTLYWKWWANVPVIPFKGADTVVVTFRVKHAASDCVAWIRHWRHIAGEKRLRWNCCCRENGANGSLGPDDNLRRDRHRDHYNRQTAQLSVLPGEERQRRSRGLL